METLANIFDSKIETYVKSRSVEIVARNAILVNNTKFGQTSKFSEISRNVGQKWKRLSKIKMFINNRKLGKKSKCGPKIDTLAKK